MVAPTLFTLPEVARRLGVTERRADYAARAMGVEPVQRVGTVRVYDQHGQDQIREAVERIASGERRTRKVVHA